MIYALFVIAALSSYLICGINPAIILSKAVYKKDIRKEGSKNPGFTNFKRCFGWKLAWLVLLLDLAKSFLPCALFGFLFGRFFGIYQIGVAYTGFFSMLGHAYPALYRFQGGKAFLVGAGAVFLIDWRVGLAATVIFALFLFTAKYMSLASVLAAITCPITLALVGYSHISVLLFCIAGSALLIWRHKTNIVRLANGSETKFYLIGKPKKKESAPEAAEQSGAR